MLSEPFLCTKRVTFARWCNATASSRWPQQIYSDLKSTDKLIDRLTGFTQGVKVMWPLSPERRRGTMVRWSMSRERKRVRYKDRKQRERGSVWAKGNNRERVLLACRGRSRISYAQEVGVIKIDMSCIRPGQAQLGSHWSWITIESFWNIFFFLSLVIWKIIQKHHMYVYAQHEALLACEHVVNHHKKLLCLTEFVLYEKIKVPKKCSITGHFSVTSVGVWKGPPFAFVTSYCFEKLLGNCSLYWVPC